MIATGIIVLNGKPVRYVHGEASTFSQHVHSGESLLITNADIYTEGLPDRAKAQAAIDAAMAQPMRTIIW